MNQLDIASDKNEKKLDFVLEGTRVNLLENRVVLVVPKGNPAGVKDFKDVGTDAVRLVALGNDDVPVGQYSREIFTNMGGVRSGHEHRGGVHDQRAQPIPAGALISLYSVKCFCCCALGNTTSPNSMQYLIHI